MKSSTNGTTAPAATSAKPIHLLQNYADNKVMSPFFKQVYSIVEQIPHGKVISYGQIARILGRPRAAREVGWAMRRCPEHLPWQRVVMSDGSITGGIYADMRKALLEGEGVVFLADGRVDMEKSSLQLHNLTTKSENTDSG